MSINVSKKLGTNHPPEVSPEEPPHGRPREVGKPDQDSEVSPPHGLFPLFVQDVGDLRKIEPASIGVRPGQQVGVRYRRVGGAEPCRWPLLAIPRAHHLQHPAEPLLLTLAPDLS